MKIDVVTPSMTSHSGGVGVAVANLYGKYSSNFKGNALIKIHSLKDGGDSVFDSTCEFLLNVEYKAYKARTLGLSKNLIKGVCTSDSDIIHSHGIWMLTTLAPLCASLLHKKPYVISPHGMLDPWIISRGRLKKFVAMWGYEKWSWSRASVFHALNAKEAISIRQVVPKARIVVAPNGIDVRTDDFVGHVAAEIIRFLFLGRFHPKKNLHSLATAICAISDDVYRKSPFVLDIVGWGDELYEAEIRRIASAMPERFNFLGPKFGEEKDFVIKQSHCFILPSFSEGQPVAVLEAMKAGTPVLINANCNMPELSALNLTADCGVRVDEIKQALLWFLALSDSDRQALRRASFDYVYEHYSWSSVLPLYEQMYKELV